VSWRRTKHGILMPMRLDVEIDRYAGYAVAWAGIQAGLGAACALRGDALPSAPAPR
jgi:hypothetical protein